MAGDAIQARDKMGRLRTLRPRLSAAPLTRIKVPEGKQAYEHFRGSAHERGYDRKWRKLRDWWIRQHPLCQMCEEEGRVTAATEVDHIEPISRAPQRRLDPTNLQSLCHPHHVEKTHREDR